LASLSDDPAQALIDQDVVAIHDQLGDKLDQLSGTHILVTGASGMLGGYIADVAAALNPMGRLASPCTLHLATRESPRPEGRLGHLVGRSDVNFIVGDATGRGALPARADVVVHAASPASPLGYLADPVGTLEANSRYLQAVLELAHASNARSCVYISSSEVYGDPPADAIPTPETYVGAVDPLHPRSCYVEGKRFGEALSMAFVRQHQVPLKIIRPFHIHGPGLRIDDGRIVAELIRAALQGVPFTLSSDGMATRCYGYASDAVFGIYAALLSEHEGQAFNIGVDSPETRILELATLVAELAGTPPPRASAAPVSPHLAGAPRRSRPDLSKARSLLGYSPRVTLREGLARTIEWHRAWAGREWADR
jgi:dTDP-glucose 4,6-dehydratase/UDP-glucuronate decarboxylase